MTLYIDTTQHGSVRFVLDKGKTKNSKTFKVLPQESDRILALLDGFFKQSKISNLKSTINKIVIYKGQGSFTGLRVGAAIAQGLSLAWDVPVKVTSKK